MDYHNNEMFCKLIVEYRSALFHLAYGILKNSIDAEDAVSETTYKAYINYHKLRDIDKFKPWVMKILINEAYLIAKKRKKIFFLDEDILVENNDSESINTIVLWEQVQRLSKNLRVVTILFYYEDMSVKEISKVLNIPVGTVNSRLNRARQRLKNNFLKDGIVQYE